LFFDRRAMALDPYRAHGRVRSKKGKQRRELFPAITGVDPFCGATLVVKSKR
jgi:hypothetical protein